MQQLIVVVFVLLSLWGAAWFLKRKGLAAGSPSFLSRGRTKEIESLDRIRLSPQHSIYLLRVEGRKLLVAVHPGGVTLLNEGEQGRERELTKGAAGS